MTGALRSRGWVRKCSSTMWKPSRNSAKRSLPIAAITDSPIAESTEYRPPTQSQKPNMLSVSMPTSATSAALVLTATKCFATASVSASSACRSQVRAAAALVSVSRVVKVFEAMMNSVVSASRSARVPTRSAGSTLETKWQRIPAST